MHRGTEAKRTSTKEARGSSCVDVCVRVGRHCGDKIIHIGGGEFCRATGDTNTQAAQDAVGLCGIEHIRLRCAAL